MTGNSSHMTYCCTHMMCIVVTWVSLSLVQAEIDSGSADSAGASIQSVFGHREIVTCLSYSGERGVWGTPGSGLLATGSHDATVMVWRWCGRQKRFIGSLNGLNNSKCSV